VGSSLSLNVFQSSRGAPTPVPRLRGTPLCPGSPGEGEQLEVRAVVFQTDGTPRNVEEFGIEQVRVLSITTSAARVGA
jgi:hypothetical protein